MLATLQCFFSGHDYYNATSTYTPVLDNAQYRVRSVKSVECPRCYETIEVTDSLPPKGIHHTGEFKRISIIEGDETPYYKVACWCGWSSRWYTAYGDVAVERNQHESLEVNDVLSTTDTQ